MSSFGTNAPLKRVLPSSEDFARFQLSANFLETVCLHCYRVLGTSSHMRGLAILEYSHRCPHAKDQKQVA